MPKLSKDDVPEVKLDSAGQYLEVALTKEQRRGLFERPGTVVVAIVELTSKSYTGHAEGEEKSPQVKVRLTGCEAARDDDEANALLEAKRSMYRKRRMDGTLDEIGTDPMGDAENVLQAVFGGYPSEREFQQHRDSQRSGSREPQRH